MTWQSILKKRKAKKKDDCCTRKVKARYDVWPSAYASGAVVQRRKVGCANWGKKSKIKKQDSKWVDNLSDTKKKLLESEPSFEVNFPELSFPDSKKELPKVIDNLKDIPNIKDYDENHHKLMLDIVGESLEDWKKFVKDADTHIIKLKMKYKRPRPYELTDKIKSVTDTDDSPSFPSGHASEAYALEKILANKYPDKKKELKEMADKIAMSRVHMGNHFPSDIKAGKKVGYIMAEAYLNISKSWEDYLIKDWVSCSSCTDNKKGTEPCGRKDASKGTKRRCRPTCSACKDYKRRGGKPKKRRKGTFSREEDEGLHGWFKRRG